MAVAITKCGNKCYTTPTVWVHKGLLDRQVTLEIGNGNELSNKILLSKFGSRFAKSAKS